MIPSILSCRQCSLLVVGVCFFLSAHAVGAQDNARDPGTLKVGIVRSLMRGEPDLMVRAMADPFEYLVKSQTGLRAHVLPSTAFGRTRKLVGGGESTDWDIPRD